jgi:hypothetical protein
MEEEKMSTGYINSPFSGSFTALKLRYKDYDQSICEHTDFIHMDDKVNVFINFESVLNRLSLLQDIENKLLLERDFKIILEAEAVNLCAHYKRFFRQAGLPTRVFLYYTDLNSTEFSASKYNDEYRSFYLNKYTMNPKFQLLGGSLLKTIIPDIKKILEFIPDVHFISAHNIEGSLVPLIVAESDKTFKNFIITADMYDTQYQSFDNMFCTHIIKRMMNTTTVLDNLHKTIEYLFKDSEKNICNSEILLNPVYYTLVISTAGSKTRSIDPLKGIGYKTFLKYLASAIQNREITDTTQALESVVKTLPIDEPEQTVQNFKCMSLQEQFNDLTDDMKFSILNQIVNRFDYNSLMELNASRYVNYPLMLQELTM